MSNLQFGLLTSFLLVGGSLSGCAAAQGVDAPSPPSGMLTVDLQRGIAQTDQWRATVQDCSTEEFSCLRIINHFDFAFPKKCEEFIDQTSWMSPVGQFRVVAPEVHYGLPYGTYISVERPNVVLFYRPSVGFSEIRLTLSTPYEDDFDPNAFSQSYKLKVLGRDNFFGCVS